MTWLYIPGVSSPSAPASEGSTSACDLPSLRLAASATWRGKPRQPASWSRAWKTGGSIRRLSGLTLPPSTQEHGVAQWIASCRAIPASPTAYPALASAPTTTGGCLIAFSTSCAPCGLLVSSERTSQGMQPASSRFSSRHWNGWVIALRQDSSKRPKSARLTSESGFSLWRTPLVHDSERGPKLQLGISGDSHPVVNLGLGPLPENFLPPLIVEQTVHHGVRAAKVSMLFPVGQRVFATAEITGDGLGAAVSRAIENIEQLAKEHGWL